MAEPTREEWLRELTSIIKKQINPYIPPLKETLDRVRNLIQASDLPDSTPVAQDALRAAVVLLHACFEDFLRTVAENLLPVTDENALRDIALVGSGRGKTQLQLGQLFRHRGKTVDELIRQSVAAHLERSTFNNMTEVCELLEKLGVLRLGANAPRSG